MPIQRKPRATSPEEFLEGVNSVDELVLIEQIQELEQKLAKQSGREQELVVEIEQLRSQTLDDRERQLLQSQIDELRSHLKQSQGSVEYPISKIRPNPQQTRQTFTEEVEVMKRSLQEEGQLDDVMLFADGTLFDGECRWRAASSLGWETIRAVFVIRPSDDKTLRRRTYLANRHRRDLNALDRAESLIAIACGEIEDLLPEEVPRITNRVLTRMKRKKRKLGERLHQEPYSQQQAVLAQLELEPVEMQVFSVFLKLQEHPGTLNRTIFPTLSLASDLKLAVRERRLGCPQALVLNRLCANELNISQEEAQKLRNQGIEHILANNLSEIKTQQWVAERKKELQRDSTTTEHDNGSNKQVENILTTVRQFDLSKAKLSTEQRQKLKQTLASILEQLEEAEPELHS